MNDVRWETNDNNGFQYIYYSNGLGWGYCRYILKSGYIDFISVYPHGQGIGTIVLSEVENTLKKHGHRYAKLTPLSEVEGFYRKRGYYQSWWDIWWPPMWRKQL